MEEYIVKYGEPYRQLIEDSLKWLDEKEPIWGVVLDRDEFISNLVSRATPISKEVKDDL